MYDQDTRTKPNAATPDTAYTCIVASPEWPPTRTSARVVPIRPSADAGPNAPVCTSSGSGAPIPARQHLRLTRILHWATLALLIAAVASACARDYMDDRATRALMLTVHQSTGLAVLAVTALRLAWRAYARVGRLHAERSRRLHAAVIAGHYLLYGSMLALAILGWLTSNAFGMQLRFLELVPVPTLIARNRDLGDDLQQWHADAAWILLALVLGHVAAALWHHYVHRNDVLRSMWRAPGTPVPRAAISPLRSLLWRHRRFVLLAPIGALLLLSALAHADGGENGSRLYDRECADCHSLAKPLKNKKGPGLVGIMDKPAASVAGFKYSEALKTANIVWTWDKIDAYIASPKRVVSGGGKMKYDGLDNADERAAIIEFLSRQE